MATSLGESTAEPSSKPSSEGSEQVSPTEQIAEKFWNLPNTITVIRTGILPILLAFPLFDTDRGSMVMGWLFVIASVGDVVDGWLARRGAQVTRIGKLLDPLADKLIVATSLVVLISMGRIPEWATVLAVVIIGRELAVTGLRGIASAGGQVMAADWRGKLKTVAQNTAIGALLFPEGTLGLRNHELGLALLVLAAVLTLWSGYAYFAAYFGSGSGSDNGPAGGTEGSVPRG